MKLYFNLFFPEITEFFFQSIRNVLRLKLAAIHLSSVSENCPVWANRRWNENSSRNLLLNWQKRSIVRRWSKKSEEKSEQRRTSSESRISHADSWSALLSCDIIMFHSGETVSEWNLPSLQLETCASLLKGKNEDDVKAKRVVREIVKRKRSLPSSSVRIPEDAPPSFVPNKNQLQPITASHFL